MRRRRTVGQRIGRAIDLIVTAISMLDPRARRGIVYVITAVDPRTGLVVDGYVGKTRQTIQARVQQHLDLKPWAPAAVDYRPEWSGRYTNLGLTVREIVSILWFRPIFNFQWNRLNSRRIPIWKQREIYRNHPPVRASVTPIGPGNPPTNPSTRYGARRPNGRAVPGRPVPGSQRTRGARQRQ